MSTLARLFSFLLLPPLLLLAGGCASFGPSAPVERTDNPDLRTGFFTSPSRATPQEQWEYAASLEQAGKLSKSARAYRNLMYQWPDDPLAGPAQLRRADLHVRMEEPDQAFKHYRFLLERYPDRVAYGEVVDQMIALAAAEETRVHGKFLFLPGFTDPVQAVPLYRDIVRNAPRHPRAAGCLLRVGQIHHEAYEYDEAITACNELIAAYPQTPEEVIAVFQKVLSSEAIALEKRNDDQAARAARAAALFFVDRYPDSPQTPEARATAQRMYDRLATSQWKRAHYYDALARKPKAALLAYRKLVEQFPVSEWTEPAKARINQLMIELEPPALKP